MSAEQRPGRDRAYNAAERVAQAAKGNAAATAMYERAKEHVISTRDTSVDAMKIACKVSHTGAIELLQRMEDEGIISAADENTGNRVVNA